jgi:polysaccharide biosynthesis protein PslH
MKLLQLCHKPVFAPLDGGKIAMMAMAEGLKSQDIEVFQWMIESPNHPIQSEKTVKHPFPWKSSFINTKVTAIGAFKNLYSSQSYNLSRFNNQQYHQDIIDFIESNAIDVVLAEGIFTIPDPGKLRRAGVKTIILRSHNVEHLIWQRISKQEKNVLKRGYLNVMSKRLKADELSICRQMNGIIAISDVDALTFKNAGITIPIEVVGIGMKFPSQPIQKQSLPKKQLFHLGSMNWLPNIEGIDWFITAVWPKLRAEMPDLRLALAGYEMPERFKHLEDQGIDVKIASDSSTFLKNEGVMIVPLLSGSGIRVKIIEGMALGINVISTKIGAEGIPAENGKHLFIADSPEAFVLTIKHLFSQPSLQLEISENAITFANANYRIEALGAKSSSFIREVLGF